MEGKTVLTTALTAVIFLHFVSADVTILPSQNQYLAQLLNVTIEEIEDLVDQFKFRTDVSTDNISIIQCFSDGTNTSFVLSNLISGSSSVILDVGTPIVFIIHGYSSSGNSTWVRNMANAYHDIGINNTFSIDWSSTANLNYFASANATKNVGELIGKWLFNLRESEMFNFSDVHLVGHSLGAHVSGFIGKTIFGYTKDTKIGRISGLDVAAPLFEYPRRADASNRLNSTDADVVEAYHTNIMLLGFLSPVGTRDFYINNGGPIQPFCINIIVTNAIQCSHGYSHEFFRESITNDGYTSRRCAFSVRGFNRILCSSNEVVIMGHHNNETDVTGVFYGNTDRYGNPVAIA